MNRHSGLSRCVLVLASLVLAIGPLTGTAYPAVVKLTVNCNEGESIGEALGQGGPFNPLVVVVQGTCTENVTITRDNVTLQGDPATGGAVTAANPAQDVILIDGARRVVIDNLELSGGQNGVAGVRVATFTVQDCTIRDNVDWGIMVDGGAATITGNTIRKNGEDGILVFNSAHARIGVTDAGTPAGNTIEENTIDGIQVGRASSVDVFGNLLQKNNGAGISAFQGSVVRMLGLNTVQLNKGSGVFVRSASFQTGFGFPEVTPNTNEISNNDLFGIQALENADIELRNGLTISNNKNHGIFLRHGSRMRVRETTVSGNMGDGIRLEFDSSAQLLSNLTVTGNTGFGLRCTDEESRFVSFGPGISIFGNGSGDPAEQVSCTPF